ncbi:MAG TPA: serine/threonine-protein kinase [Candidatus Sulfotelmatobacter sp.]|nr:serine/threonine-protein kinase [Candidatus Sulfotelmatobacter sp.]
MNPDEHIIGDTSPDSELASHDTPFASTLSSKTVIGPYHLLHRIGVGGMGEVWLAEQKEPINRRVAIKLIKAGMDSREVVGRFESERQTLALMDHPAIAKVLDAGSTEQGAPYFVMEYVNGIPITTYCDKHRLTTEQRLELFMRVCEGVQHAHQKAILHRDLKPSNILVSEVDGKPAPRIIDFGVAKATAQRMSTETLFTQFGSVVGTPAYMSPEQADSAGVDVDTRTDVYSLGVVLYELLVGALPLDFTKSSPDQFRSRLRDEDAPRPSTKLKTAGAKSDTAAEARNTDITALLRQLRGDLDAITLKCLEKDRARRYATPADLATDVGRYLQNEPVVARPASLAYRARKYARRHRVGVVVAGGVAVLLIAGAIAQTIELRRIRRERDRADRVTKFMTDMFKVSNPSEARGNDIRAREILDKASNDIESGLKEDPELQARMMYTMGLVYESLGLFSKAETLFKRAADIRRSLSGASDRGTLQASSRLANALMEESRFPEAEKLARETLDLRRQAFGPKDRDTIDSATQVALILDNEGRFPDAEKLNRETLEVARRTLGPNDDVTHTTKQHLAIDLAYEGKYAEAEKFFREIYEDDRKQLGPDNPRTMGELGNIGSILLQQDKYSEAEKVYREALATMVRVLGPEHPRTLLNEGNLAQALRGLKRYAEAETLLREVLAAKLKTLGPDHRSTLVTKGNLAEVLGFEGKNAEAEQVTRETLESERRTLGPDHTDTLVTLEVLAELLRNEKHYPESEKLYQQVFDARLRVLGPDHSGTALAAFSLSEVEALEGKHKEAMANLEFAVDHQLADDFRQALAKDDALNSLHGDPRFAELMAKSQKMLAAGGKTN